jgi:hypothetical protein
MHAIDGWLYLGVIDCHIVGRPKYCAQQRLKSSVTAR